MDEPVFLVVKFTWSLPFDCLLHARSSMVAYIRRPSAWRPLVEAMLTNHLLLAASLSRYEVDHPLIVGIVKLILIVFADW